ncbi:uncharacterized protein LOC143237913 isoform X1 [Tachypleus tridentatus]|uniref:uncharacterized protein LOC143237913 isoform X1 n=1 Tax=Tachypleus tridentatus TaxID=6853 RepID=UPI003FD5C47E
MPTASIAEHPRPEYLAKLSTVKKKKVNFITGVNEPCVSFWKRRVPCTIFSWTMVLLLCGTGGCLFELSLQLGIIVAGKQFINAAVEMDVP